MAGFGHRDAFTAGMVAQDGRRAAQRLRHRQPARRVRQPQHRLDLPRQLIAQQQCPAAAERPTRLLARQPRGAPGPIDCVKEGARKRSATVVARHAVVAQRQRATTGCKQQIPARLRRAVRDRLQQQRVAAGLQAMEGQKVGIGR